MATVLSLSGSPSGNSRTARLLRYLDARLVGYGHEVIPLDVRTIPAEVLLGADLQHPAVLEVAAQLERVDGVVVVGTPIYQAAYSGVLKALLDLLPQFALAGKTVLPLATGGTTAHVPAIDYALRPVLGALGATHVAPGWFVLDIAIAGETVTVSPVAEAALHQVVDQFSDVLARSPQLPGTGVNS